jgi:hypothetical protein
MVVQLSVGIGGWGAKEDVLCQPLGGEESSGGGFGESGQSPHVDRGHIPRGPPGDPSRRWRAAQKARLRARPAARPAQNGTRRPPQRRRAAETVNGNVNVSETRVADAR